MRKKLKTSILRRFCVVDRIFAFAFLVMRFCRLCFSRDVMCRVTKQSLKCENCYRYNLKCDLTLDYQSMNKALKKAKKLKNEIFELRLRLARKKKQRRHWRRRLKNLDDHEFRNILKIEAKKTIDESSLEFVNDVFFFFWIFSSNFDNFVRFSRCWNSWNNFWQFLKFLSDSHVFFVVGYPFHFIKYCWLRFCKIRLTSYSWFSCDW